MTYDAVALAELVRRCLEAAPLTPLSAISETARIDRHTLTRAIRSVYALTFRELRARVLRERVARLRLDDPSRSGKEIAFALGYRAANSLARQEGRQNTRRISSQPSREPYV
jgi:methylphosphotriester-DNA--protein-cysteine methyltransferase